MDIKDYFEEILFTKEQVEAKCKELAEWINDEYKNSSNLIIVGLLKGSVPFLSELIKNVKILHRIDFMIVSSFSGTLKSTGNLKVVTDLNFDIYNQNVLIVDDIIDSGLSFSQVVSKLKSRKPKSIKTMAFLDKKEARTNGFQVDKFGFEVPNKFLVGFGLDFKEKLRNTPFIGVFDQSKADLI